MKTLSRLDIAVLVLFVANVILAAFTVNVPSCIGWLMATVYYYLWVQAEKKSEVSKSA